MPQPSPSLFRLLGGLVIAPPLPVVASDAGLRVALEVVQVLSFTAMAHKHCFASAARQTLGQSLVPLHAALRQHISSMWWMFDIGQFSNTNSPRRHFGAVHSLLEEVSKMFASLSQDLE